jgi:hypothetical protein
VRVAGYSAYFVNLTREVQDKVNKMRKTRFEVEEDIRRRRLEPLDPEVVVKYVSDLKKFLESSNIFERRAFLGTFIDSMEVDDGEITFNYGLPRMVPKRRRLRF